MFRPNPEATYRTVLLFRCNNRLILPVYDMLNRTEFDKLLQARDVRRRTVEGTCVLDEVRLLCKNLPNHRGVGCLIMTSSSTIRRRGKADSWLHMFIRLFNMKFECGASRIRIVM
jgi:hypothetical protein